MRYTRPGSQLFYPRRPDHTSYAALATLLFPYHGWSNTPVSSWRPPVYAEAGSFVKQGNSMQQVSAVAAVFRCDDVYSVLSNPEKEGWFAAKGLRASIK